MDILNLSINFNLSIEDSNSFLEGLEYKKADLVSQVSSKRAELDQVRQDICTEIEDSEDYKRYKNWKDERSSLIDSTREKDMRILELESINSEL